MKKIVLAALIVLAGAAAFGGSVFALDEGKAAKAVSGGEWLAAEMPLQNWLGISESERMKIARNFADDYYEMDKSCSYAKIKAFYDEKKQRAFIYVECLKRDPGAKKSARPSVKS
ncbi:MAG: hypothetical protein PHG91_03025 [Syntrophales bacterium]|nr:hypothetical protein [Syntrophales bacterium]MDD5232346.1 hypothetical protein [Syntrophales bacterium]MDD5531661.1 hypothetical protein [Syntrophales bacterium]HPL63242.1 hypothetical protein [Syntrophales bacterium]